MIFSIQKSNPIFCRVFEASISYPKAREKQSLENFWHEWTSQFDSGRLWKWFESILTMVDILVDLMVDVMQNPITIAEDERFSETMTPLAAQQPSAIEPWPALRSIDNLQSSSAAMQLFE